jgi:hypothetical protein
VRDKKEDGGAVEPEKKKELKEFLRLAFAIVEQEHAQMPKVCSICGGKMEPSWQALVDKPKPGDILAYKCRRCGNVVEKFFEFPEEYARFFKKTGP